MWTRGDVTLSRDGGGGGGARPLRWVSVHLLPLLNREPFLCRLQYVIIAILLCLVTGGLLLFFLLPRSVNLESSMPVITPKHTFINATAGVVTLTIEVSEEKKAKSLIFFCDGQDVAMR